MILRTPIALWLIPLALVAVWLLRRSMTRPALALRFLLLATLAVALAEPLLPGTPAAAPLLVIVDQSASLPATDREQAWAAAQAIARQRPQARTVLAALGADVELVEPGEQPGVNPDGTDLAAALRLAGGFGGRTLLLSDGGATTPGTDAAAQQLRKDGVVVDVLSLNTTPPLDARVAAISLPGGLREGQAFAAEIAIDATGVAQATLHLREDGVERSSQAVTLKAGRTVVPFNGRLTRVGIHSFEARIELADAHLENNALAQTALVGPAPKVLVIERTPDSAAVLRDTLERGGIQSEARRPADLPARLSELERFDSVILNDVAATDLTLDQQATLREYVRALGHGLIALGGQNSFGLGDYRNSPLEAALPVEAEPPPKRERQQVALLLIIDRSASMHDLNPANSKLELAKSAAIAATQALVPDDRLGIVAFDSTPEYIVPFSMIGAGRSLSNIQERIAEIRFGGGTNIYDALAIGLPELAAQPTLVKHAVLLTDGVSYTRESYDRLVEDARAAGITLSTIAIGADADLVLLEHLADIGGGRYHFADNPQDLPRLTLEETEIARSDPRVQGTIQPQVEAAHPTVRGLVPSAFPQLESYVATTPKANADTILRSPDGDTLLAGWQFGLGRALAWTSDGGGEWAPEWQRWESASLFWSQLLAYTFPDPSVGPLRLRVTGGTTPALIAEAVDAGGAPLDLADVGVRVTKPDGSEETVRLQQIAPGRYTVPLTTTLEGAYNLGVGLRKDTTELSASVGYVQAYPAEYAQGPDQALLTRIAQTTGGATLTDITAALDATASEPPRPERPLWPWFVGLALILWLLEIAVRRGWLRWGTQRSV